MSAVGLPVKGIIDPVMGQTGWEYATVPLGPNAIDWRQWPSSSYTTSNINWTTPPPQIDTLIDPRVFIYLDFTLSFTGTTAAGNPANQLLLLGSSDGLRAWPLMSMIGTQSLALNINNSTFTQAMDVQKAMMRFSDFRYARCGRLSTTPTMMDQFQNYGNWRSNATFPTMIGAQKNPLAFGGENPYEPTRGAFPYFSLTQTSTTASIRYQIYEPLWFSPLEQWQVTQGLHGIQTMTWNLQIQSFANAWSHDAVNGNTLSTITGTINTPPTLYFKYLTVNSVPRSLLIPYNDIWSRYVTAGNVCAVGTPLTITSNSITIDIIPRIIYFFGRPTNATQFGSVASASVSDAYLNISRFVLQWGGQGGLFSAATEVDLFMLAQGNGYQEGWLGWHAGIGSVLALRPGIDFPLPPGKAAGMVDRTTFSFTVTFNQLDSANNAIVYDLYTVPIVSGALRIENSTATETKALITESDVLRAWAGPKIPLDTAEKLSGAGLWDSIKSFASKAYHGFKNHVVPIAKDIGSAARVVGNLSRGVTGMFGGGGRRFRGAGFIDDSSAGQYRGEPQSKRRQVESIELPDEY